MRQGRSTWQRSWTVTIHTDGSLRPSCVRCWGLSGKAMRECVESSFAFNRCLRQGSVEAPRFWQKMATQILANVDEEWMKQRKGVLMGIEPEREVHQICSFIWADNFWIMSRSKKHLEQMLKYLMKKRLKWIWSPNLQACGGRAHMLLKKRRISFWVHQKGCEKFPLKKNSTYWDV